MTRDADARAGNISPRIVAELRDLHQRNRLLAREAGGPRGRAGRRQRREARQSEDDLLRVLGFTDYDAFERALEQTGVTGREGVVSGPLPAPGELRRAPGAPEPTAPDASPVTPVAPAAVGAPAAVDVSAAERDELETAREAKRTEAALLRVLRDETLGGGRRAARASVRGGAETDADSLDELHGRVAAVEEELAETRFEIVQLRDELAARAGATPPAPAGAERVVAAVPAPPPVPAGAELGEALAHATGELRALWELLRGERAELAVLGERARAEAERLLADAATRAEQLREDARADAQRIREDAAADAARVLERARAEAVALTRDAMVTLDGLRRLASETRGEPPPA